MLKSGNKDEHERYDGFPVMTVNCIRPRSNFIYAGAY
jgi:hypothetical protein